MNTPMNLSGARALAVGAGLTLALAMGAAPTAAMAEVRVGTTDVTVKADISNVSFKAPTVIPFAAQADGKLVGPSDKTITIDNLSAYGIHVTNMKVTAKNDWTIVADAKTGSAQNSIDFKVGPDKAEKDASSATQTTGLDLSKDASFEMKYQGIADGTDKIKLNVSGHVARVTRDIYHAPVREIKWQASPGRSSPVRTPRPKAIALAAIVGILASAPAMAFAQQEQAQAATEVTVDLSGLNRGSRHEPLAQTSDTRQLIATGAATAGAGLTCLGLHIKRNQ